MLYTVAIAHVIFSLFITLRVIKSKQLLSRQKVVNICLTWIIPFLYGLITYHATKYKGYEVTTKKDRRISPSLIGSSAGAPTFDGGDAAY